MEKKDGLIKFVVFNKTIREIAVIVNKDYDYPRLHVITQDQNVSDSFKKCEDAFLKVDGIDVDFMWSCTCCRGYGWVDYVFVPID